MCQKVKCKLVKKSKGDVDDNSKRGRRRLKVQKTLTCLSRGYLYFHVLSILGRTGSAPCHRWDASSEECV
jgi:hypothetical protein